MKLYEITEEAIMAKNPVQFQKGLGLYEFLEDYGSEEQCREALYRLRWPNGYVCPHCGNTTGCEIKERKVYHKRQRIRALAAIVAGCLQKWTPDFGQPFKCILPTHPAA